MSTDIVPVVLAGGAGTRLWPLSRTAYPKQFIPLIEDSSLFMSTLARGQKITASKPIVVCNEEHRFLVAEQLRLSALEKSRILLEPEGKNTAPAIALAALASMQQGEDPLLLVSPSDHVINDEEAFVRAVEQGKLLAQKNSLVTFGIEPTRADGSYGYIQLESTTGNAIRRFVEKPDLETAESFVSSGDYVWNSGIFLFRASVFLAELEKFAPAIHRQTSLAWKRHTIDGEFQRPEPESFVDSPADSIDYAVMENSDNVAVVPMSCGWSDLGSWESLWTETEKDSRNNVVLGDVEPMDTEGCYLRSTDRLLTTIGVKNLVIMDTSDALLVADKSRTQEIKKLVDTLRSRNRAEVDMHARVYRPWGDYEGIDQGERYQVKRIVVRPGAKLSLQRHHHRAEHWIVVRGTAIVTRGEETEMLTENQSTYIPLGEVHRLENPGSIPLELIEVQSGSYLGEDDIVRYDDVYGRES
ncbi:MAG: mannose-1-phosphate guanylyltransferase/mannose-6-phosphate isomerase [Granulosicoccus sp.]|nr:mannose-1-phosphate guanylyltransferase/mannose-6-phosphate isomerase [Granulosicoccus sp.]